MTIIMSEKHQVTIPKKVAAILHLKKGSLFRVEVKGHRIELIPLETVEKSYTVKEYEKLDKLFADQKGKARQVTRGMIARMEKGIA